MRPALLSLLCLAAAALASAAGRAGGDVFLLKSGGRVAGAWVNEGASAAEPYRIQTEAGPALALPRASVQQVIRQRSDQEQYERAAPSVADTVEDQWQLAQWCREHHLPQEREIHLRRILQLDPQHLPARRALGYSQVGGQWVLREEHRRSQGLELYRGRWRMPQEIEILENHRQTSLAEKEWAQRLRAWRELLASNNSANIAKARQELLKVSDPNAVSTLADFLARDRARGPKLLYITVLANIGDSASVQALFASSLADPDEEVRVACLDELARLDPPGVAAQYIRALGDRDNHKVNRAACALARFGDEAALGPLIEALVTTHSFTYEPPASAGPQTVTTTFKNDAAAAAANRIPFPGTSSGLSMGSGKKTITQRVANQEVLATLVKLAGSPNYGYDQPAWRAWLESQHHAAAVNGRGQ